MPLQHDGPLGLLDVVVALTPVDDVAVILPFALFALNRLVEKFQWQSFEQRG